MSHLIEEFVRAIAATALVGLLCSCGGGGIDPEGEGTPTVVSMLATSVAYGKTMTVTVNGSALTSGDLTLVVEGPCGTVSKTNGSSATQMAFTCKIAGLGDLIPRVRTAAGVELASLRLKVPMPQVQMTVTQGARSGSMIIELDPTSAPVTVDNFLAYVNSGFYQNIIFHRVEAGFVVQAGGWIAGPTVRSATRAAIKNEASNGLKNLRGTIAMARTSDPDSATSQFYFNLADNASLDFGSIENPAGYAVFGRIVSGLDSSGATLSGLDILDEIGKVPVAPSSRVAALTSLPVTNVVITAIVQSK